MNITILWADDEIELLKPHILFLKEKGYDVVPVCSGRDALDEIEASVPDLVFLDEQMPGLSGIDTLKIIKERWPQLPVVMITKSEEEHIMEDALGGKISDYLIKPVNPSQILLTVKKHTEMRRLQSEHSTMNYQQQFREIGMQLGGRMSNEEWVEMYKKLVYWELELAGTDDPSIHDIFLSQKDDANRQYCRFYEEHYRDWLSGAQEKPTMSTTVLKERLFPLLKGGRPTFLIVIDNFRYDQWKFVQPLVEQHFRVERDDMYYTILPTTTQFARNAMFAGLMPSEIEKKYPQYWVNEDEEGYKNQYENELLDENLRRHGFNIKHTYNKVLNAQYGKRLVDRLPEMMQSPLNVIIYNFIDMLSHARTDSDIVRELAEEAYHLVVPLGAEARDTGKSKQPSKLLGGFYSGGSIAFGGSYYIIGALEDRAVGIAHAVHLAAGHWVGAHEFKCRAQHGLYLVHHRPFDAGNVGEQGAVFKVLLVVLQPA